MATTTTTTTTTTFLLLLLITLSSTIHARESQFFAKFNNNIPKETQPLNTNQQDPNSLPQTKPDGGAYGLYGHESGQLPPSATVADNDLPANLPENYNPVAYTTPIHSNTQEYPEEVNQFTGDNEMYKSENQEMGAKFANGENMYNSGKQEVGTNMYNYEKQGMSDTRFMENGRYKWERPKFDDTRFMEKEDGGNMYNSQEQGSEEMYNSEKQGMGETKYSTSGNGNENGNYNMYNMEKQGMSDTRFLENGKYFYDLNSEKSSRGFESRNGYNTNGYNGNNNNYNSYDRYNSNGGYQNQEEFQDNQYNP